jgi:hypothetical protein
MDLMLAKVKASYEEMMAKLDAHRKRMTAEIDAWVEGMESFA